MRFFTPLFGIVLLGLLATSASSQIHPSIEFFLEPGIQYGRALQQKRFRESNERIFADVGVRYRLGDGSSDSNRVGVALHASFGSRDAYFAVRPRYTRRLSERVTTTFSAGWIFAVAQQDNLPEDATLSDNGFVGGAQISHGDIALGIDARLWDVGPSRGYEGGTETSVLAGISLLGSPGIKAAVFGAGILLLLSAVYVASL